MESYSNKIIASEDMTLKSTFLAVVLVLGIVLGGVEGVQKLKVAGN